MSKVHVPGTHKAGEIHALCDQYHHPAGLPVEDKRHERFTRSESMVTCEKCKTLLAATVEAQVQGTAYPVTPQAFGYGDLVRKSIAGEEPERPQFFSWRSAIRVLIQIRDEGAGLKSSSDPGRFEALPQASSGPPEGDRAQREAGRLAAVSRALDGAFTEPFVVSTHPTRLTLHPLVCTEILIGRVVGRLVSECPILGCDDPGRC